MTTSSVIQVDKTGLPFQASQHRVSFTLESCGCRAKSEWHDLEPVKAIKRDEGGLFSFPLVDFNLPVVSLEIHWRKILSIAEPVQRVVYP